MKYQLWINAERTVLVRYWENGAMEVCSREHPDDTWGPPTQMIEEVHNDAPGG